MSLIKKYVQIFLLILTADMLGTNLHAQTIKYTYDASGNRILRKNVINMSKAASGGSMTKSFSGETKTEEVAVAEVPKYEDVLSEMKITIYPKP